MGDFRHGLYLKIYVQPMPEIHLTPQSPRRGVLPAIPMSIQ